MNTKKKGGRKHSINPQTLMYILKILLRKCFSSVDLNINNKRYKIHTIKRNINFKVKNYDIME